MSLPKEWLPPLARALIRNDAKGPVYAMGDQITWFTHAYALRVLKAAGLLRNASVSALPSPHNPKMVSFRTVLAMLGFEEFYDIDINGRAALTLDFSQPLCDELRGRAGVVIDIGTCEHIFNLPQVFTNLIELLRPGGTILHLAPISWYNHGFVNFNPIWFKEFYQHNHFHLQEHSLIVSPCAYYVSGYPGPLWFGGAISAFQDLSSVVHAERPEPDGAAFC